MVTGQNIEFGLANGRKVSLDAMHIAPSLAGVLEGTDDGIRRGVLRDARRSDMLGERPVHVIEPPNLPLRLAGLPHWHIRVWLQSDTPLSPDRAGSELVVAFFVDTITDRPINEIVADAVRTVDWSAHAEDHDGD